MSKSFNDNGGKDRRVLRVLRGTNINADIFSDVAIGPKYDSPGSDRQNRRSLAGQKKYIRSRTRFHVKMKVRELVSQLD